MTGWRKSSHSFSNGNCAECRAYAGTVEVRDSKDAQGPVLRFTRTGWQAFLTELRPPGAGDVGACSPVR